MNTPDNRCVNCGAETNGPLEAGEFCYECEQIRARLEKRAKHARYEIRREASNAAWPCMCDECLERRSPQEPLYGRGGSPDFYSDRGLMILP